MSPRASEARWGGPLAEWLLLLIVVATSRDVGDPARLLAWLFGSLPRLRWEHLHPWLALLYGLGNVMLLVHLACVASAARWAERVRTGVAAWFVFALLVVPMARDVAVRFRVDEVPGNAAPYQSGAHDGGVLQTEMATRALIRGENPYRRSYAAPPMSRAVDSDPAGWRSIGYARNPAFEHFPYMPGVLLVSAPLQSVAGVTGLRYDARVVYLAAAVLLAVALARMVPAGSPRRMVVLGVLLCPLVRPYLVVGRNDVLVLAPLALFGGYVVARRYRAAAVALGVALALKQFAVVAVPFLALAAYLDAGRDGRAAVRACWPALAIPAAVALPFVLWDAPAFLDDTVFWNLGRGAEPYPVKWGGWGVSLLGYGFNLVDQPRGPNPFGWLALPTQLAALVLLGRAQLARPTPRAVLFSSAVLLFVTLWTSRAFALSYAAVPALLALMALLAPDEAPASPEGSSE